MSQRLIQLNSAQEMRWSSSYYLLRQTHRTIVGHHDEVYVAGEGGDYIEEEEASSPTGGIGADTS